MGAALSTRFGTEWREDAVLADGTAVVLRAVRPDDKELLLRAFDRTSPESRYRRFFAAKSALTPAELAYLTEVDGVDHVAIGAVLRDARGTEEGIGVARFVRVHAEPGVAEPAVAVVDEWQGKGLGRLLLGRLVAAARDRGVERFRTYVLARNAPMMALLDEIAAGAVRRSQGEVVEVDIPLVAEGGAPAPESAEPHGALHRLLAVAAEGALCVLAGLWRTRPVPPSR